MTLQKNIALFFALILVLITGVSCNFPGFGVEQPPTPTVSMDIEQLPSDEVIVTVSPEATTTPAVVEPTEVPTEIPTEIPTATPEPVSWEYEIQEGSPVYIENIHHINEGESWMSVGGQVFDADGQPVKFIVIKVEGVVANNSVNLLNMTGAALQYGPAGYEVAISPTAFSSTNNMRITLFDKELNQLSETYYFDTYTETDRVTTIINFVAVTSNP